MTKPGEGANRRHSRGIRHENPEGAGTVRATPSKTGIFPKSNTCMMRRITGRLVVVIQEELSFVAVAAVVLGSG